MKQKMLLILLIIIVLCGFKLKVDPGNFSLIGRTIIIDPGHGGKDPGTLYKDIYEKDLVLTISKYLETELTRNGARVIMTRYEDYDLSSPNAFRRKKSDFDNRIKIINNSGADLYVSVHLNFLLDSQYYGPQVFYDQNNQKLADYIQSEFNKYTSSGRKIKKIPETNYLYSKLQINGVLIECGFLSNVTERKNLQKEEYQIKLAKIITKGIIKYLNNN